MLQTALHVSLKFWHTLKGAGMSQLPQLSQGVEATALRLFLNSSINFACAYWEAALSLTFKMNAIGLLRHQVLA